MINIQVIDTLSKEAIEFAKREWIHVDMDHFGRKIVWKKEKKALQATNDNELVGILELTMQAGVMYIDELIVSKDNHRKGIGRELMQKAENIAKLNKLHKIYLVTGENWPATKFYESLGYQKTGVLQNHYEGIDYIVYTKFL